MSGKRAVVLQDEASREFEVYMKVQYESEADWAEDVMNDVKGEFRAIAIWFYTIGYRNGEGNGHS